MPPFVHRETVRFRDLDACGHVNNAVYLTYAEQARIAYLRHVGIMRSLEDMRMILARAEIDFRSPAAVDDEVAIEVRPTRVGTKSFDLEYVLRAGERVVAQAKSVLVGFDYRRGESIEIPDNWKRSLSQ